MFSSLAQPWISWIKHFVIAWMAFPLQKPLKIHFQDYAPVLRIWQAAVPLAAIQIGGWSALPNQKMLEPHAGKRERTCQALAWAKLSQRDFEHISGLLSRMWWLLRRAQGNGGSALAWRHPQKCQKTNSECPLQSSHVPGSQRPWLYARHPRPFHLS